MKKRATLNEAIESCHQKFQDDIVFFVHPDTPQADIDRLGGRFLGMRIVKSERIPENNV